MKETTKRIVALLLSVALWVALGALARRRSLRARPPGARRP